MHILVGGGTGFIGKHLCAYLRQQGHRVTIVSRTKAKGDEDRITWRQLRWDQAPSDADAIINLAGNRFMDVDLVTSSVFWSTSAIESIESSRLFTAKMCQGLCEARAEEGNPLKCYIQASSYLYYHCNEETEDKVWTEEDKGGHAELINRWFRRTEEYATLESDIPTRQVIVRLGNVLHSDDGMLRQYLKKFGAFLGGPVMRKGQSPLPWIHMEDAVRLLAFPLESDRVDGILNGVAPTLTTHRQFCEVLAQGIKRPNIGFCLPGMYLHHKYGADRFKIICESPWVSPERTLQQGYHFMYGDIQSAMPSLLTNRPSFAMIVMDNLNARFYRFKIWAKAWYYYEEYVINRRWNLKEMVLHRLSLVLGFLVAIWGIEMTLRYIKSKGGN